MGREQHGGRRTRAKVEEGMAQRGERRGIRPMVGDTCRGPEGGRQGDAVPGVAGRRGGTLVLPKTRW